MRRIILRPARDLPAPVPPRVPEGAGALDEHQDGQVNKLVRRARPACLCGVWSEKVAIWCQVYGQIGLLRAQALQRVFPITGDFRR